MGENERRLHIGGDASGHIIVGDHNTSITTGQTETVNIGELVRFATAVEQALPALELEERQKQSAEELTTDILRSAKESPPDHGRLRRIGRSLRAILEGAAGNALAEVLLRLWSP